MFRNVVYAPVAADEELLLDSSRVLLPLFVGEGLMDVASLELSLADSLVFMWSEGVVLIFVYEVASWWEGLVTYF